MAGAGHPVTALRTAGAYIRAAVKAEVDGAHELGARYRIQADRFIAAEKLRLAPAAVPAPRRHRCKRLSALI